MEIIVTGSNEKMPLSHISWGYLENDLDYRGRIVANENDDKHKRMSKK